MINYRHLNSPYLQKAKGLIPCSEKDHYETLYKEPCLISLMLIYQVIRYHKRFGKGLLTQAVCSIQPVRGSARKGLKEHQEAVPSRCSLLVSLRLLVPLLPGGCEGLPQDCCFASTDARRLSIPAACLVSPATAHATEQIPWCPNRTVSSSLSKVNARKVFV